MKLQSMEPYKHKQKQNPSNGYEIFWDVRIQNLLRFLGEK
jgi:hypothetical protein